MTDQDRKFFAEIGSGATPRVDAAIDGITDRLQRLRGAVNRVLFVGGDPMAFFWDTAARNGGALMHAVLRRLSVAFGAKRTWPDRLPARAGRECPTRISVSHL